MDAVGLTLSSRLQRLLISGWNALFFRERSFKGGIGKAMAVCWNRCFSLGFEIPTTLHLTGWESLNAVMQNGPSIIVLDIMRACLCAGILPECYVFEVEGNYRIERTPLGDLQRFGQPLRATLCYTEKNVLTPENVPNRVILHFLFRLGRDKNGSKPGLMHLFL